MKTVKEILLDNNFKFAKKFGQNFITDKLFLSSIVELAEINSNDDVLEIGAGAGTLTKELATKAKNVVSYEIDNNLKPILKENLNGLNNIKIIFKDALKTNILEIEKEFKNRYKIVANLPYYITTPLLFKFLEETNKVDSITVMVQKEVADRIVGKPNTKDYGILTLAIDFLGDAKIVKNVSRNMFYPIPNVDSAIVRIDINKNKYDADKNLFTKIIKSAFAMRRKTLINNLMKSFNIERSILLNIFKKLNFNENIRGEVLSTKEFVFLTNEMSRHI